jgi:o-succinylbenzoate synthase
MPSRIVGIRWTPFAIPFAQEFATAASSGEPARAREGLIVEFWIDGAYGLGEASPLPERADGTTADAAALLREIAPRLLGADVDAATALLPGIPARPGGQALRCALDVALLDLESKAAGRSLAAHLAGLYGGTAASSVPVNATIGARAPKAVRVAAERARAASYPAAKLKVGLEETVEAEVRRVAAARGGLGPDIRLRLDANAAWTVAQALATLPALAAYDLEWVEQPVVEVEGLAAVRRGTDVPVAADESVVDSASARAILEAGAADVLVLKPMSLGGLRPAADIARLVQGARATAVVTTTIDTGVGTAAALQLAATLPAPAPPCGLATASLLEADLVREAPPIAGGEMCVSEAPGLGVDLDRAQLARYQVGPAEQLGQGGPE